LLLLCAAGGGVVVGRLSVGRRELTSTVWIDGDKPVLEAIRERSQNRRRGLGVQGRTVIETERDYSRAIGTQRGDVVWLAWGAEREEDAIVSRSPWDAFEPSFGPSTEAKLRDGKLFPFFESFGFRKSKKFEGVPRGA
jgi:hypothetical protein